MTTVFPQIKRVDEDETSKIIKNVLFNNQERESKQLDKIFDDVLHLTRELPYSDEDEDDDNEKDDDDDGDDDDEEDDEEDDDEDDDDEDDDEEDDDDVDDEDEDSDSDKEQQESTPPREPTSWNLDQFIKPIPAKQKQQPLPPPPPQPQLQRQSKSPQQTQRLSKSPLQPQRLPKSPQHAQRPPKSPQRAPKSPRQPPVAAHATTQFTPVAPPQVPSLKLEVPLPPQVPDAPSPAQPSPSPPPPPPSSQPSLVKSEASQPASVSKTSSASSKDCIVQIDLSKLKRVPQIKSRTNFMITAKALKHEADAEKDKTKQAIKYLESSMYFVLHAQEQETTINDTQYYNSVTPLLKHVLRMSAPASLENLDNMTNLKIHALAQKCLSWLQMKMYKFRERELPELLKTISTLQTSSPIQQADEVVIGVKPRVLSAYRRQISIYTYLKQAHDHWHNVEHLCDQHPALRIFFSTIESNCGPLTLVSPFPKLMDHVQCGLKLLKTS